MHVVAIISQKGGVGKTTLTSTLAVLAQMNGRTVAMVDTDLAAGLALWHRDRQKHTSRAEPRLLIANDENDPDRLRKAVKAARTAGIQWLFIDTAAGIAKLPVVAAEVADLVLIPCSPSKREQLGTVETAQMVKRQGKPAYFVVNKGSASKAINDACALGLSTALGLPALDTHIIRRAPTVETEQTGEVLPEVNSADSSVSKGKAEFRALWDWVRTRLEGEGANV